MPFSPRSPGVLRCSVALSACALAWAWAAPVSAQTPEPSPSELAPTEAVAQPPTTTAPAAGVETPVGPVVTDVQVYGLLNHHVDVLMVDGAHIQGDLIGYDPNYVILENPDTRQRYQVERRLMSGLRMALEEELPEPPPPPGQAPVPVPAPALSAPQLPPAPPLAPLAPPRGIGKIVTGSIMTGVGGTLVLSSMVFVLAEPDAVELFVPLSIITAVHLGVGIPMLATGLRRERRYRRWRASQQQSAVWVPSLHIDRRRIQAGFRMTF